MDGVHIYAGKVEDGPKDIIDCGRPYQLPEERLIGSVLQPKFAGWVRPTLQLKNGVETSSQNQEPFGRISGPCCFGGMSEFCFDFRFYTSLWASPQFSADIAMITRKAPQVSIVVVMIDYFASLFLITIIYVGCRRLLS